MRMLTMSDAALADDERKERVECEDEVSCHDCPDIFCSWHPSSDQTEADHD
jgi:hypothetical protein